MGMELPGWLQWLEWIVGSDWPEGDETAMRRAAEAWTEAGDGIDELIGEIQETAANVLGTIEGEDAEAFRAYVEKFVSTDPQYLPKLSQACDALGNALEEGAMEIEYAKYMFIALLIMTAIEIYSLIAAAFETFGASTAGIPVVEAGAQVASRNIAQQLIERLTSKLLGRLSEGALKTLVKAVIEGALHGALQGGGLDLVVQGVQVAQGHRDGIDLKQTGTALVDGAVGGAISGGVGAGMSKVPGLGGPASGALGGAFKGAGRELISEGVSEVAGSAATSAIHGQPISGEDLAKSATSGAFGGVVGGGKEGMADVHVPHVSTPDLGGASHLGSPPDFSGGGGDASGTNLAGASSSDGGALGGSTHGGGSDGAGPASAPSSGSAAASASGSAGTAPTAFAGGGSDGPASAGTSTGGGTTSVGSTGGPTAAPTSGGGGPSPVSSSGGGPHVSSSGGSSPVSSGGGGASPGSSPGSGGSSPVSSSSGGGASVPSSAGGGSPAPSSSGDGGTGAPHRDRTPLDGGGGSPSGNRVADALGPHTGGTDPARTPAHSTPETSPTATSPETRPTHTSEPGATQRTAASPSSVSDGPLAGGPSGGAPGGTSGGTSRHAPTEGTGGPGSVHRTESSSSSFYGENNSYGPAGPQRTPGRTDSEPEGTSLANVGTSTTATPAHLADGISPSMSGPATATPDGRTGTPTGGAPMGGPVLGGPAPSGPAPGTSPGASPGGGGAPRTPGDAPTLRTSDGSSTTSRSQFYESSSGERPRSSGVNAAPSGGRTSESAVPGERTGTGNGRANGSTAPPADAAASTATTAEPHAIGRSDGDGQHDASGDPPAPHPSPVPESLPPHLHDVYLNSEETPNGRSFFLPDDQNMRDLAQRVQIDPKYFVIDGHGSTEGMWVGGRWLTVRDVADLIRADPNWDGREVLVISCETGQGPDSFAAQLSRELGQSVTAPEGLVWTDEGGRVFASSGTDEADGTRSPTWPPDGAWNTFGPEGTATSAGRDGFSPGHTDSDALPGGRTDGERGAERDGPGTRPEGAQARGGEPDRTDEPSAHDRGDEDSPRTPQEERLQSPGRDEFRQDPQHQIPFSPPDVPPERTHPVQVGPGESFIGSRPLEPNSRYDVTDGRPGPDGQPQRRSTVYTGPDGRVTHVDGQVSNLRRDDANYVANPDIQQPLPDTQYRVEIGDHVQTYATGPDGMPQGGIDFSPPPHRNEVNVGPGGDSGITPPDPHKPFDPSEGLQPYTRYEVTDTSGNRRGTYYTDGEGRIHWVETESGRMSRNNPELQNLDPDVHYRTSQTFDPDRPPPQNDTFTPRDDATRIRVHPDEPAPDGGTGQEPPNGKQSFARREGLEPNARYEVYNNQGEPRGIFYTDEHGKVRLVDTFRPFNPDLNNPQPNTQYSVDDGKFHFETGPQNEHLGSGQQRPENVTDTSVGTVREMEKVEASNDFGRRDPTAQQRAGSLGGKEEIIRPDGTVVQQNVNDGGHTVGHQYGGPGELVNMISQLRAQNQGNNDAALGLLSADTWHAMEGELADVDARADTTIDQFNVFALRNPGDQVPHTVQVRWVETIDGTPTVHMRSFPNV